MEFCSECNNMLYISRRDKDLFNYCKLCGNEQPYDRTDNCVFSNDYKNSFLSFKAITNKYIKYDPTLPRVRNIRCPNDKCIINETKDYFRDKLVLSNMNYTLYTKILNIIPKKIGVLYPTLPDISPDDSDTTPDDSGSGAGDTTPSSVEDDVSSKKHLEKEVLVDGDTFELILLLHNRIIINTKGKEVSPLIKILKKIPIIKKNKVSVKRFTKPMNEVIFIKYDHVNMKYLYYCCYCDMNWKNT